jgi:hypothetical protein
MAQRPAKPGRTQAGGVLLEAQVSGEEVAWVLLGIGLNVHRGAARRRRRPGGVRAG